MKLLIYAFIVLGEDKLQLWNMFKRIFFIMILAELNMNLQVFFLGLSE